MSFTETAEDRETKRLEQRLRRLARAEDAVLRKSHRRNPNAPDYGAYWLIDSSTNGVIVGGQWGASLGEVAAWFEDGDSAV